MSISVIVNIVMPDFFIRSASFGSISLAPMITTFSGLTKGMSSVLKGAISWAPTPVRAASGIPCTLPVIVVSKVLKSVWASIHKIPTFLSTLWTPKTVPTAILWSPPSTTGKAPSSRLKFTCFARASFTTFIWSRCLARVDRGSSNSITSTGIFPLSL